MAGKVRQSSLFAGFLSSFAVQAGYNYERYQNLGLLAILLPALKDINPDPEDLKKALARHSGYFNTNPYLATFTAGALIRAEEESADLDVHEGDESWTDRFKRVSGSVLGNLGDRFFWGGLRPLAGLIGILAYLLSPLYGALALIVVFNIPQIVIRAEGMRMGYEAGRGVVTSAVGDRGSRAIIWVKRLGALALGMVIPFLIAHPAMPGGSAGVVLVAGTVGAGWFFLRRRELRTLYLFVLAVALILILAITARLT